MSNIRLLKVGKVFPELTDPEWPLTRWFPTQPFRFEGQSFAPYVTIPTGWVVFRQSMGGNTRRLMVVLLHSAETLAECMIVGILTDPDDPTWHSSDIPSAGLVKQIQLVVGKAMESHWPAT